MYRQILVNVRKNYVTYIVCYIAEFCHELTKGFNKKKRIKKYFMYHTVCIYFHPTWNILIPQD